MTWLGGFIWRSSVAAAPHESDNGPSSSVNGEAFLTILGTVNFSRSMFQGNSRFNAFL